jgi:hypothetical protein
LAGIPERGSVGNTGSGRGIGGAEERKFDHLDCAIRIAFAEVGE